MPQKNIGLEAIETASIDEIRHLQFQRLHKTLHHVYHNSPVYRQKFDQHGVHPDDLKKLEDLCLFPFTVKNDLREQYPFGLFCLPIEQVSRIHASSGTTGQPIVVGYSKNDIQTWAQVCARSIYAAGGRPGDKVHVAYGYGLFTGGLGAHYGAELLGCTVIPMSGGQTEKQVQLIQDFAPDIIMVTPSYLLNIAASIQQKNIDPTSLSLRIGILGAEPWSEAMRDEIEAQLAIDAVDIFGLSEVIGPGVAQECIETKDGLTIWEDHFYPEIIDPDTNEVLPDGEKGELVLTTLSKEALPVIRYRTRDISCLLPGSTRTMRRIQKITGRYDDMLIIRGVNVFPSQIEEQVLSMEALAPHYLIEISEENNMAALTVHVEFLSNHAQNNVQHVSRELADKIKNFIGISVQIAIKEPGTLPRSEGKSKRVIDRR